LLKGVEVDADEVDGLDAMLAHGLDVLGVVAEGEQAAVDFGVQRLEAAVHHFGEAGDLAYIGDDQAVVAEEFGGAAGADQLDAEFLSQRFGELCEAGFVGDGEEGALHGDELVFDVGRHRGRHNTPSHKPVASSRSLEGI
jgi:hypothetical protein